ncbi:uncharacterized protein VP01_303g6 [Puccinia sorghi]|uniref:Uncharacterized protein n=1 Tax=Puccinia sorghi TaxID=27349 RepID=A0A0L6V000_9BASI|nr:uncharacterized protein VP01_303g6 [Puccinia sorghi]
MIVQSHHRRGGEVEPDKTPPTTYLGEGAGHNSNQRDTGEHSVNQTSSAAIKEISLLSNLEEQTRVTTIVAAVVKRFNPANILKPDGSNLRQRKHMHQLHASERFGNTDFFSPEEGVLPGSSEEKIGRGIINSSVHTDHTHDLLDLPSSAAVFDHIMMKFRIVNRAALLKALLAFINIDPTKHDTTAGLHSAFNYAGKSFFEQGFSLSWDEMQGLIIQTNLRGNLRCFATFGCRSD